MPSAIGFPTLTSDVFLNRKPNEQTRRLLIAAEFHFGHSVEKTVKNITSLHKSLSASAVKVNKFQDDAAYIFCMNSPVKF